MALAVRPGGGGTAPKLFCRARVRQQSRYGPRRAPDPRSRTEAHRVLDLEIPPEARGKNRVVALKPCAIRDANGRNSFSFNGRTVPPVIERSCTRGLAR